MPITDKKNKSLSRAIELADRLEADIARRRLKPGESYLTTLEASRFLGVAGASANLALQLLEKRQIIRRSQKKGSVILDPPIYGNLPIDHVRFLVHGRYYITEGVGGDGILLGIQSEMPTSTVSHCFLTPENEIQQVVKLVERAISADNSADAFVLVRASYDTQKIIAKSGLPAVVYGEVYRGIEGLSQIDHDHAAAIRLSTEYLQKRNRNRVAVFMRQHISPGEHRTFDTLLSIRSFTITLRFNPHDENNIECEARALLSQRKRPDAFLCQTLRQAECVQRVRKELKISKSSMDIVVLTTYLKRGETVPFPHIALSANPESLGRRLGSLLLQRSAGQCVQETVPVRLIVPD